MNCIVFLLVFIFGIFERWRGEEGGRRAELSSRVRLLVANRISLCVTGRWLFHSTYTVDGIVAAPPPIATIRLSCSCNNNHQPGASCADALLAISRRLLKNRRRRRRRRHSINTKGPAVPHSKSNYSRQHRQTALKCVLCPPVFVFHTPSLSLSLSSHSLGCNHK